MKEGLGGLYLFPRYAEVCVYHRQIGILELSEDFREQRMWGLKRLSRGDVGKIKSIKPHWDNTYKLRLLFR